MSWLSDYLDKHGMKKVNETLGGAIDVAGTVARRIPGVGLAMDIGDAVGSVIPGSLYDGGSGDGKTPSKTSLDYVNQLLKGSTGGDILNTIGRGIGGYMSNEQAQAALAQRKAEFDQTAAQRKAEYERTTGNSEATSAANAEQALNRAPLADKSQYQLMARMGVAPTAFKPRDYTQGLSNIASKPTGGYGDVMDTMAVAAKSYTPGAGNVDTAAIQLLKNRMLVNAKSPAMPASTPASTPSAGGGVPPVTTAATSPAGGGTGVGAPHDPTKLKQDEEYQY